MPEPVPDLTEAELLAILQDAESTWRSLQDGDQSGTCACTVA